MAFAYIFKVFFLGFHGFCNIFGFSFFWPFGDYFFLILFF